MVFSLRFAFARQQAQAGRQAEEEEEARRGEGEGGGGGGREIQRVQPKIHPALLEFETVCHWQQLAGGAIGNLGQLLDATCSHAPTSLRINWANDVP